MGRLVAVAALLVAVCFAPAPASAQSDDEAAELGLEVVAGYGGSLTGRQWLPVEVRLQPARLVGGTLTVATRANSGRTSESQPVEVTAGSRKVYRFLLPAGPVAVSLQEPGREEAVVGRARGAGGGESWVAGYLGELPSGLPPLRHEPTGLTGGWVGVDPAWVELSADALEPVATLVAPRAALAGLTDAGRRNLAVAVAAGTDLVVVAGADGPPDLAGLGVPWEPATDVTSAAEPAAGERTLVPAEDAWALTYDRVVDGGVAAPVATSVAAGRGRVSVVAVAPGEGAAGRSPQLWGALTGPGGRTGGPAYDAAVESNPWLLARLLQPEGGGAPRVPWLAGFMLVYVLVVGPVNVLVLRRFGRRELAWVTVPIVSVVFTAASFLGAVGQRPPQGIAGSLAYWIDGVGTEVVVAGGRAPTPGRHTVAIDGDDWTVRPLVEGGQGGELTRGNRAQVAFDLPAMQLGGVVAARATTQPPPLEVQAVAGADGVEVTVTNRGAAPLHAVNIRAATAQRNVGALAPGQTETVTLGGAQLASVGSWGDPFSELPAGPSGEVTLPGSLAAVLQNRGLDGSPGLVWAVGTVDEASLPVLVDGRTTLDRGGMVAVGVRPAPGGGAPASPYTVHRDLVFADRDSYRPHPLMVEGPGAAVLRFRLPPAFGGARLQSQLEQRNEQFGPNPALTIWDHQANAWIELDEAFGQDGGDPARIVSPLGELYVRAAGELWPFDFSARAVTATEEAVAS